MAQDYWWVTRPKRKLNSIPEELAAFCSVALNNKWSHNRELHKDFETELENDGTKAAGDKRDASGSGGRTHAVMLYSLGLWFEKNDSVFLTLAGQAIMDGKSPVEILKKQVLLFQYPSAYSSSVRVTERFRIRPYIFLLKLLSDNRIGMLTQEEIAFVVAIDAENESSRCYETVVERILQYRDVGDRFISDAMLLQHDASRGNLMDVANTMMNWLDYTQLVNREKKVIMLAEEKRSEIEVVLCNTPKLIPYPSEADVYQRKYGVDPWHQKDTRNILNSGSVSSRTIDKNRILKVFFNYSSLRPVKCISSDAIMFVCNCAGTEYSYTEEVLLSTYPHGALGGYLSNYRNMAFQGRDEATDFELATTNLFCDVFGYKTKHLGQTGSKSAPDVLLVSETDGYQAIIDNKAYSKYSVSGDHHNRMVHNYIKGLKNYSDYNYELGFFTYISGGFIKTIDSQIKSESDESGVCGSAITVATLISLIEKHLEQPYSHEELRQIFGINRQVFLSDIGV